LKIRSFFEIKTIEKPRVESEILISKELPNYSDIKSAVMLDIIHNFNQETKKFD
jgi:hypothetical protein